MSIIGNPIMIGGGGKNISSIIIITGLESTDTITCTKDGKSYTATWDSTAMHWKIVGLPLGTFTVTATNGTKTKTETVLIDIAGVYEIEMSFKLWLYRDGDECEDVTGGWQQYKQSQSSGSISKNSATLSFTNTSGSGFSYNFFGCCTVNQIDVSSYTKLCAELTSNSSVDVTRLGVVKSSSATGSDIAKKEFSNKPLSMTVPITELTFTTGLVFISNNNSGTISISKIWLE